MHVSNSIFNISESHQISPDEKLYDLLMKWANINKSDPKLVKISGNIRHYLRSYPDRYTKLGRQYRSNMSNASYIGLYHLTPNLCVVCSIREIDEDHSGVAVEFKNCKNVIENMCFVKYENYEPTEMIFRHIAMRSEDCLGWEGYKGKSEQIIYALPWSGYVWTIPELLFNTIMDSCKEVFIDKK